MLAILPATQLVMSVLVNQPIVMKFGRQTYFDSENGYLTKNHNVIISRWWRDAVLKLTSWLYLSIRNQNFQLPVQLIPECNSERVIKIYVHLLKMF